MKLKPGKYLIGLDLASEPDKTGYFIVPCANGRVRLELGRTATREEFRDFMEELERQARTAKGGG